MLSFFAYCRCETSTTWLTGLIYVAIKQAYDCNRAAKSDEIEMTNGVAKLINALRACIYISHYMMFALFRRLQNLQFSRQSYDELSAQ